jgi:hypothetical protein
MVKLVRFGHGFTIKFHGLLRAEVDTGKARNAVVTATGFGARDALNQ